MSVWPILYSSAAVSTPACSDMPIHSARLPAVRGNGRGKQPLRFSLQRNQKRCLLQWDHGDRSVLWGWLDSANSNTISNDGKTDAPLSKEGFCCMGDYLSVLVSVYSGAFGNLISKKTLKTGKQKPRIYILMSLLLIWLKCRWVTSLHWLPVRFRIDLTDHFQGTPGSGPKLTSQNCGLLMFLNAALDPQVEPWWLFQSQGWK